MEGSICLIRIPQKPIIDLLTDGIQCDSKNLGKADRISHMTMIVHENLCEALELTKRHSRRFC